MVEEKIKGEKTKIYLVIGLAVVAAVVAYFRFFHKEGASALPTMATMGTTGRSPADLEVPKIDFKAMSPRKLTESVDRIRKAVEIRDLFSPLADPDPDVVEAEKPKEEPIPKFSLSGTILGGGAPIAIINNKFLRLGDEIQHFRVQRIEKNRVQLSKDSRIVTLEVVKRSTH